ncbi:MAG TPA: methyltransferase domain-containing protein [Pseudolabrys sp.]|jgi:SAM-dependent methyltransferase
MSGPSIDPDAFRDFERAAHSRNAATYHDLFTVVTDRAIEPLLDAAKVGPGTRLLDVAAGPGRMTQAGTERGARAIGVDLAPAMVAIARRLYPKIEFREASADALPFSDASFDAAVCAFGLGHFPDSERVIAEFRRVLAPRGTVALSWWEGFSRNRINGLFHEAIGRLAASVPGAVPPGPPMDRFSDRTRFAEFLCSAGFENVQVTGASFTHTLRNADELWDLAMGSFARAAATIGAQTEVVRQQIRAAVTQGAQQYATSNGLEIPVAFLIGAGERP